jgi:hypothetical protein
MVNLSNYGKSVIRLQFQLGNTQRDLALVRADNDALRADDHKKEFAPLTRENAKPGGHLETIIGAIGFVSSRPVSIESPDHFIIRIVPDEDDTGKGFLIYLENNRLDAITQFTFRVLAAQSFDHEHKDWRQNLFSALTQSSPQPIHAKYSSNKLPFVRKIPTIPELLVGNNKDSLLKWPPNDLSETQKWLLHLDVMTQTMKVPNQTIQLPQVKLALILEWNTTTNGMVIERQTSLQDLASKQPPTSA